MRPGFTHVDTVELEFNGRRPSPGELTAALHRAVGLNADAVSTIRWLRQRIYIDLDGRAGRRIHTPFAVRWTDGSGVFRRPTDLPTQHPMYTISVGTDFSSPGELQRKAFADGGIVGEDIGVIRRHPSQTTFTVPVWRYRQSDLPLKIDGSATTTEKKNAECAGSLSSVNDATSDNLLDVLRALCAQHKHAPDMLRQAAHEFANQVRYDPTVNRSIRRLSQTGWQVVEDGIALSPWTVILRLALAPSEEIERYRAWLRTLTFPSEDHLETEDLLELIMAERLGEPHAVEPVGQAILEVAQEAGLETRVLGSLAPGARAKGLTLRPDIDRPGGDDVASRWWQIAYATATGDASAAEQLAELDILMQDAAPLGAWPTLRELVQAEIDGSGAPLFTPLSVLEPQTDRYIETAIQAIDEKVRLGDLDAAQTIVIRSLRERPDSDALVARALRLGKDAEPKAQDPIALTMYAEQAWKRGDTDDAVLSFLNARPPRGSLTAQHVARRLAWTGHLTAAHALISEQSDTSLRLSIALALELTEEAIPLWAMAQGDRLGLEPPPAWAPERLRQTLPAHWIALLEGSLSDVHLDSELLPELSTRLKAIEQNPFATWRKITKQPQCNTPLEAFLSTPDAHDALVALAGSMPGQTNTPGSNAATNSPRFDGLALIDRLVAEVADSRWEPEGIFASYALLNGAPGAAISLSNKRLLEWSRDTRPQYRRAANLVIPHRNSAELQDAWNHSPKARLIRAQQALDSGSTREARRITTALLTRAVLPEIRHDAAKLLLGMGDDETVATLLSPSRSPGLQYDMLRAIHSSPDSPETRTSIHQAVRLISTVSPTERLRKAARLLLTDTE